MTNLFCIFKSVTGIPCPGCGSTRAIQSCLKGDIATGLWYNPVAVLLLAFGIVAAVWWVVDLIRGSRSLHRLFHTRWPAWTIVVAAVITLANWIWNIEKFG